MSHEPSAMSHQPSAIDSSLQSETAHDVTAACDDLLIVDPDVAAAREHVDVRARFPRRAGLAPVRVAEGEVDAGDLLVLQQHADHVLERDVGAEGELADATAVLVGVAVLPELLLEILARAVRRLQP